VGKDHLFALDIEQDATVGGLVGPSPLHVKLVIAVRLFGPDITKGCPEGMHHPIFHIEEIFGFPIFTVNHDVPVVQVLAVKEFDLLISATGEDYQAEA
jgi:hypothetical protein